MTAIFWALVIVIAIQAVVNIVAIRAMIEVVRVYQKKPGDAAQKPATQFGGRLFRETGTAQMSRQKEPSVLG